MIHPNRPFLRSVGMMIGAIVGAGVFGLPYAFAQTGVGLALFELLFLGGMLTTLQLMLGEVVTQTPGQHRIVGYIGMYLGKGWMWVSLVAHALGIWGAMLAYMVIGGTFLHVLLGDWIGGDLGIYAYVIAAIASILVFGGLRFAAKIEYWIVGALLFLFAFIGIGSAPHIELANLSGVDWTNAFAPYGVILFSLGGMAIVPELKDVLGKNHKKELGRVIVTAMIMIIAIYTLFSMAVVGVTGVGTTMAAFDGLVPYLGESFRIVASVLGLITIISIYMVLGIQLLNTFKFDFHVRHRTAWALVVGMPILLFSIGFREFIDIIGFVGGVFGGVLGVLIALTYWQLKRKGLCKTHHCINYPSILTWLIILIFISGIAWQLITTIS